MNPKNTTLSSSNIPTRFSFLDICRGIAAMSVVFSHALENSFPESRNFTDNILNFGQIGIVAFFLISGFIIPYTLERSKDLKDYVIRRFFRIYPLYFFAFVLGTFIFTAGYWNGKDVDPHISTLFFLSHLSFTQEYVKNISNVVPGSWTLFLEIIWYILAIFIFYFFKNKKLPIYSAITLQLILSLISIAIQVRFPLGRTGLLICCIVGYATYLNSSHIISLSELKKIVYTALFTLTISTYVSFGIYHIGTPFSWHGVLLSWAIAFFIFFLLWSTQKTTSIFHKIFSWLGEISYSLYLVHGFVIFFLKSVNISGMSLFISVFPFSIVLGWVTWRIIELPGMEVGRKFSTSIATKAPTPVQR
jgi:peptidoglycan/LPS O-acetylase OafA/YrhL